MILSFITFVTYLLAASSSNSADLLVKTDLGYIQGHLNYVGVREWNGIPYAQPPVGALRWEQSRAPEPWTDTYDASFMTPGCIQRCNLPPGNCPEQGTSEDCLYLSIWAPPEPSSDPEGYPVFFWIHGGAFEQGLGDCALYNGTNFATLGVVSVAINYRLGAFGFMAGENMEGNYGILDQRLALSWINKNIKAFGGNPEKITIGGQSAGAMSVGSHLMSPGSKGLFHNAVMESNPLGLPFHTRESAKANADACFEYLGCAINDVECMKSKSAEEILDAQLNAPALNFDNLFANFLPWSPMTEEGGELPEQPLYALQNGRFNPMPMLQGSVKDEGQLFVYELFTSPISEAAYKSIVTAVFGVRNYPEIIRKYPFDVVEGSTDGRQAFNVLATDLLFYCPLRNVTRGYHKTLGAKTVPTYIYKFDHILSFDAWGPEYTFCVGWVCHGSELPFVFNVYTDGVSVYYTPTPEEVQLTVDMASTWTNFVYSGNPNKGLSVNFTFPLYGDVQDEILVYEEPGMSTVSHFRDEYCDMWDRMGFFY